MNSPDTMRQPPNSAEAERAVLGALFIQPAAYLQIADWLTPEDFYQDRHRYLYELIGRMIEKGQQVDALTVGEAVECDGKLAEFGGPAEFLALEQAAMSAANVVAYAEIVREKAQLRRCIEIGHNAMQSAFTGGTTSEHILATAHHSISALQTDFRTGGLRPIKDAAKSFYRELLKRYESGGRMSGLPTPWKEVNDLTHGLQPSDLIILAGRPGMGKSIAGFQMAGFAALHGKRTVLFSLEMTEAQVFQRMTACFGEVSHDWLRAPHDGGEEWWPKVTDVIKRLTEAAMKIDDTPALAWPQIAARAKREHMKSPVGLVVVDHLHIVRIKGKDTVRELGDISRGAKALAKELNCPVVLLAQLNRGSATRTDKRPTMADLRASGEIEQDADLIFLLHRDDYYEREGCARAGVVDWIVGKTRNSEARDIELRNRFDQMRMDDWQGERLRSAPKSNARGME